MYFGRGRLVAKSCLTLVTPWTVACQALLSVGFSRREYWSGLPFPSPGDLPDPGIEPTCQCRSCKSKIPWRWAWQPTPVFSPRESHGQTSLEGYSPWGITNSWTRLKQLSKTQHRLHKTLQQVWPRVQRIELLDDSILSYDLFTKLV